MRILLKGLLYLVIVGVVALMGYAIFFELPSPERDIVIPIQSQ